MIFFFFKILKTWENCFKIIEISKFFLWETIWFYWKLEILLHRLLKLAKLFIERILTPWAALPLFNSSPPPPSFVSSTTIFYLFSTFTFFFFILFSYTLSFYFTLPHLPLVLSYYPYSLFHCYFFCSHSSYLLPLILFFPLSFTLILLIIVLIFIFHSSTPHFCYHYSFFCRNV